MDSSLFRKATQPDFKPNYKSGVIEKAADRLETQSKVTAPIDDPRYPKYAGLMEDGRLVTDYKTHCANNVVSSMKTRLNAPLTFGNCCKAAPSTERSGCAASKVVKRSVSLVASAGWR